MFTSTLRRGFIAATIAASAVAAQAVTVDLAPVGSPGNHANFYDDFGTGNGSYTIGSPYYTTSVGAFANSASAYGTFDQAGNLWEARGRFTGILAELSEITCGCASMCRCPTRPLPGSMSRPAATSATNDTTASSLRGPSARA